MKTHLPSPTIPITSFIDEVIARVPGWTPADQLLTLFTLACATTDITGDILEIGSWCGRSTIVLAEACRITGKGKVQSVDLFPEKTDWHQNTDGTWSFKTAQSGAYMEQTVWNEPFQRDIAPLYEKHKGIFEIMQENLDRFGVTNKVQCFRGTSSQYYAEAGERIFRMAFLDGDHGVEAVSRDIANTVGLMPSGGWICFDDAFSTYEGVDESIKVCLWNLPRTLFFQQLTRKLHAVKILPAS